MKKVFVKWGFTDDYGRAHEEQARMEWFENIEQAEEFVADKKAHNGGYFKLWKIAYGDYNEFLRLVKLEIELADLRKKF